MKYKTRIDYTIEVPSAFDAEVSSSNGDVQIVSIEGDSKVTSSSGDVFLKDLGGQAIVELSSGDAPGAADPYLDRSALKISVFMDVFSVHSNRSPVCGTVRGVWYSPGRFFNAALDKASEQNERNAVWVRDSHDNKDIVCVQVAGLIARRIMCYVKEGDHLDWGQRYGFIRFGSRVDLYLPESCVSQVGLGDKVRAGLDVVAARSEGA